MHIPTTAAAIGLAVFCASAAAQSATPAAGEMPLFQEKGLTHTTSTSTTRDAVQAQARSQRPLAGEVPAPTQAVLEPGQAKTERLAAPQRRPQRGDAG